MGECHGKPTHPMMGAQEFGCVEYHLQRDRLVPGTAVPDDADLSPREREMKRRMAMHKSQPSRGPARSLHRSPRPERHDGAVARVRVQHIDLSLSEDGHDEGESMDRETLRGILAEVLDEALGTSDTEMHPRYKGGKVIVQPANPELAAKELEVDVLFKKVVGVRDKLRVLEQKINGSENLDSAEKVQIQQYITSCYGSLTSFNYLFKDREDWFVGQGQG